MNLARRTGDGEVAIDLQDGLESRLGHCCDRQQSIAPLCLCTSV